MCCIHIITQAGGSLGIFFTAVCFFWTISQKPTELGSPNLTYNVPRWVHENNLFGGQKVEGKGYESRKQCRRGCALSWVLDFSSYSLCEVVDSVSAYVVKVIDVATDRAWLACLVATCNYTVSRKKTRQSTFARNVHKIDRFFEFFNWQIHK